MLKDPNVERCIADAIKPLKYQIKAMKAEIKELKKIIMNHNCNNSKPI